MSRILIVGAGLFGSVCARELMDRGFKVSIVEKRNHIGGICFSENLNNIEIHKYGPHIFHTKDENIWKYVNKFSKFNNYVHKVFVRINNRTYSFPLNLLTYEQFFGLNENIRLLSNIQKDILFEMFIKNYSEKQWNRKFEDIPKEIITRLPIKYSYNNDYFEGEFQGIPINGYTHLIENLIKGSSIEFNRKISLEDIPKEELTIFTGCIDELFDFKFGKLEYRSLKFESEFLQDCDNFQGNSVINYPDKNIQFTRIIEHKHFNFTQTKGTWITREYPSDIGDPYYPLNDNKNNQLYKKYFNYAKQNYPNIIFGGRLGSYKYLNMDAIIQAAINLCRSL